MFVESVLFWGAEVYMYMQCEILACRQISTFNSLSSKFATVKNFHSEIFEKCFIHVVQRFINPPSANTDISVLPWIIYVRYRMGGYSEYRDPFGCASGGYHKIDLPPIWYLTLTTWSQAQGENLSLYVLYSCIERIQNI